MGIEQDKWAEMIDELRETEEPGLIRRVANYFHTLSYHFQPGMKRLREAAGSRRKLRDEISKAEAVGYFNIVRNAEAAIRRISEGYNPRYAIREYESYIKRLEEIYSIGLYSHTQHDSRKLKIRDCFPTPPTPPVLRTNPEDIRLPKRY